jgi:crotonobetainyl-CoA:carnitine CoA-transferase CaiB-like acyl-CoA transferase
MGPVPAVGEHTAAVLTEVGVSEEELRVLAAEDVITVWGPGSAEEVR